jgi:hypothetical protein
MRGRNAAGDKGTKGAVRRADSRALDLVTMIRCGAP